LSPALQRIGSQAMLGAPMSAGDTLPIVGRHSVSLLFITHMAECAATAFEAAPVFPLVRVQTFGAHPEAAPVADYPSPRYPEALSHTVAAGQPAHAQPFHEVVRLRGPEPVLDATRPVVVKERGVKRDQQNVVPLDRKLHAAQARVRQGNIDDGAGITQPHEPNLRENDGTNVPFALPAEHFPRRAKAPVRNGTAEALIQQENAFGLQRGSN